MTAHLTHFFMRVFSLASFFFVISAFALFLASIPVLFLSLFWLH
jgi:hypothetical protein